MNSTTCIKGRADISGNRESNVKGSINSNNNNSSVDSNNSIITQRKKNM